MNALELVPFSKFAEINPPTEWRHLDPNTTVSFISMSDVSETGQWLGKQTRKLGDVSTGYTVFAEDDVLFAKITPCMENGKGGHAVGLSNGIGFGSTEFHVMRKKGESSSRFLFHWLQHEPTRVKALSFMGGSAGQQRVKAEFFYHYQIPDLSPDQQTRIARILDTADALIAAAETVVAKLRQVRAGLLHDLLTRGLDPNGHLRDPAANPKQFKNSSLGRIPREWEVRTLGDVAQVDRGKFAHRPRNEPRFFGGPHKFIQTGDVAESAGSILKASSQTLSDEGALISKGFPEGTIAVTIAANIADTAILGCPMFLTDSVVGVVVAPSHSPRFVELCIRRAKPRLRSRAPQTAQMNINLQDLRPLLISMPADPDEEHRIAKLYEAHDRLISAEQTELTKLRQLKSGLMTDLLEGRVRVPEGV